MDKTKKGTSRQGKDVVDTLLSLPVRNLESRLRFLEGEISSAERLRDELDDRLRQRLLSAQDTLDRFRYGDLGGPLSQERGQLRDHLRAMEEAQAQQLLASAREITALRLRLQEAKEEKRGARERRALIEEEPDAESGGTDV